MADGGEVSGRSNKCQPCYRKGRNNDVVKFCGQCQVSFCSACLEHHDEIFDHQQLPGQDSGEVTEKSTELCNDHKLHITLYCSEDNKFGCMTCMDPEHKSCKQVIFLPISATALLQDIDINHLNEMLATTIQELETIKLKQQPQLASLLEDKEKCLENVNAYHTRALEKLNAIFRNTTDVIVQHFENMRLEIESNIQHVKKSLTELESSTSRLQQFQDKHVQQFIEVRKCQEYIKIAESASTDASDNLKIEGMNTIIDKRLDDLLTELKTLATVARRGPIQVKKTYQVDVSVKDDTETCQITASCVLPDSSILLVDNSNKRLKRLDGETLTITDTYSTEDKPIGICCIDEGVVAVTIYEQQVVLLSILPKLNLIRTLIFNHLCSYVAHRRDELYITDLSKTLYVYNMQGSLLRKFSFDTLGNRLFSRARHVVVNDTGGRIFVTDWDNGLLTLNRQWMTVYRVDTLKSSGTRGVCLDDVGGAFVCGYTANKVAYVNPEGKHVIDVLTETDGLLMPKSVCFQEARRRIFVSQEGSSQMIVCHLI